MPEIRWLPVPGPTREAQAVEAAGALAEAGVALVVWIEPGGRARRLEARHTDLPALLRTAPVGSAVQDEIGRPMLRVTDEGLSWHDHPAWRSRRPAPTSLPRRGSR